jgi:hypothetical protein
MLFVLRAAISPIIALCVRLIGKYLQVTALHALIGVLGAGAGNRAGADPRGRLR